MFENFGPFSLQGRNILITGASSGIGEQCAISCSQMGANIILIARNEERLQRTFENLQSGNHLKYSFDITNFSAIEGVISDAVLKNGKISGFVHSAGVELTMPFAMTKPEHFINVFNVNVFAGFDRIIR